MSILRRLSSNPFTNWDSSRRSSTTEDGQPDLDPQTKDDIFIWQLGAIDFCRIDSATLLRAKVVDSENYASRVLTACHKTGIIDPVTGQPKTENINRDLKKELPIITIPNQKQLVMLLFFWEEEIVRWNLLCVEEVELKTNRSEGWEEEVMFVQAKKRTRPSLRDRSGRVQDGRDELPSYEDVRREGRH